MATSLDGQVQDFAFGAILPVNLQFGRNLVLAVPDLGEVVCFYNEARNACIGVFRIV